MSPESNAGLAFWIGAAVLLQSVALMRAEPGWTRPDLPLLVALSCAFVAQPRRALACAFAAGLAADLLTCGPVGINTAADLAAAWVVLATRGVLFAHRVWVQALLAVSVSLAASVAHVCALALAHPHLALGVCMTLALQASVSAGLLAPFAVELMGGTGVWAGPLRAFLRERSR